MNTKSDPLVSSDAAEFVVQNVQSANPNLRNLVDNRAAVRATAQTRVTVVTAIVVAANEGGFTRLDGWRPGGVRAG